MSAVIDFDDTLIQRLRQRDESALAEVFESYSDRIYRLAVGLLNNEQSADGVVQDTFIALIEHIDGFEGRASIGTWLYRVAYNHCMGRLRKFKPDVEFDESLGEILMPQNFSDWQSLPEHHLSQSETAQQIQHAIEQLNPTLRAVFILRDMEDLSTEATADALGIRPGTVKVRLHRARLALREALANAFFEETA